MVFESIVADVLNRFIGDYVENLDRSQLKLGIWGGDVVLENLELKENAFASLDLPITLVKGRLEKLVLKIPWKNLYTSPVIANVEGLLLLVAPKSDAPYDAEKEKKAKWEAKQKQLQKIEEAKIQNSIKKSNDPGQDTFTEKLVAQIMKNLQIKISYIHIRYEDSFTNSIDPFAIGFTLYNLLFETKNWSNESSDKFIYKLISLDSLSLYFNTQYTKLLSKLESQEIYQNLKNGIPSDSNQMKSSFVLRPINSTAKLRLNPKPETDCTNYSTPKVFFVIDLPQISLSISRSQFQDLTKLLESVERMTASSLWRRNRPNQLLSTNRAMWWKFAYKCIVEDGVKRRKRNWSWENMQQHRLKFRNYKDAYFQKLKSKKVSDDLKKKIEGLEEYLDVFNISLARKLSEMEYARLEESEKDKGSYTGWISSMFNWRGKKNSDTELGIVKRFEEAMTAEEKNKLYAAIDYQENAAPTTYPKKFIENDFRFLLNNLSISIVDDFLSNPEVLLISLDGVRSDIQMRPSAKAIKIASHITSFTVYGHPSVFESERPVLVQSVLTNQGSGMACLLDVLFETNPEDESCDHRIHVLAQPLEIIYHAVSIQRLSEVFKSESLELSGLQEEARLTMQMFKENSATSLQHAISVQKILDLKVDVESSYLMIPENGYYNKNNNLIVAHFGSLKMRSVPRVGNAISLQRLSRAGSTEEEKFNEMVEQSYDQFNVELTGIQILLASPDEDWKLVKDTDSNLHVLHPSKLSFNLRKCIIRDDPRLPNFQIKGSLPHFCLHISDKKILQLATIAFSFPKTLGSDDKMETPETTSLKPIRGASETSTKVAAETLLKKDFVGASSSKVDSTITESTQMTNLVVTFEIGQFRVVINEKDDPLLQLLVSHIGLEFKQKTFEILFCAFIDDLLVEGKYSSDELLQVVATPREDKGVTRMLSFNYANVNRKAPDFATIHRSIEQFIEIKFAQLGVVLHKEIILKIMKFSNSIQSKLEELKPEPGVDKLDVLRRSTSTIASVYEYAVDAVASQSRFKRVSKTDDGLIKLQAEVFLNLFNIRISSLQKEIADISIIGLQGLFKMRKHVNEIQAQLVNLSIVDPKSNAYFKKILSFEEKDAFNMQLMTFDNAAKGKSHGNLNAVDLKLKVAIGSVTFIFLNKFISDLLQFVNCFQVAKEKVSEVSAAAAKSASENVREAYHNAFRAKLDFHLKSPIVIIPQNSSNSNVIIANLGSVTINNTFHKVESESTKEIPVVERIVIALDNLQLFRAFIDHDTLGIDWRHILLHPVTFRMNVVRNLCVAWYTELPEVDINGKLGAVQVVLNDKDYSTIMLVLDENFSEGQSDLVQQELETTRDREGSALNENNFDEFKRDEAKESTATSFKRLTFNITLEKFAIALRKTVQNDEEDESCVEPLANFDVLELNIKGTIWSDNKINASITLLNCLWDDSRPSRNRNGIIRMMHRLENSSSDQHMVKIIFKQKKSGDKEVDFSVNSFSLVFWIDYLMLLASFFQPQQSSSAKSLETPQKPSKSAVKKSQLNNGNSQISVASTKINFRIHKPEIVIVEDADNFDSSAIVFENECKLSLTTSGPCQNLMLTISKLQLFTSLFNPSKRASNLVEILSPCTIDIVLNKSSQRLTVNVNLSPIQMHITPYTVSLLTKISSSFKPAPSAAVTKMITDSDYSDLWNIKTFDPESFWFLRTEVANEAVESLDIDNAVLQCEQLIIEAKTIVVTIEAQLGLKIIPMIMLETSFIGDICDWSKGQLKANCSLSIEAAYFNKRLDVWEPLIESLDNVKGRRPWELIIDLKQCNENDKVTESVDEDLENIQRELPLMSINIYSIDVIDLTITKSSLEVVKNLTKMFSDAVEKDGEKLKKDMQLAPYMVKNDTGMPISLTLENFSLVADDQTIEVEDVLLESGAVVPLALSNQDVPANRKSMLQEQDSLNEHFLIFRIMQMEVRRSLLVSRAEKRYFPLPHRTYPGDQWGFVADITAIDGCKNITLRSIVQIFNHLSEAIEVYHMTDGGNELKFCGEAEAFSKLNLPLSAVYNPTNEIFFRPSGNKYSVSIVPFVWKDLLKVSRVIKTLKCEPKENGQPAFFINAIGQMEKIFYENTRKKTLPSSSYTIHVYPTVVFCNLLPLRISYTLQGPYEAVILEEGKHKQLLNAEINHSSITFRIPEYLDQEWKCVKVLSQNTELVWAFESLSSKAILDLGCRIQTEEGYLCLTLYCPYWMINKTALPLQYRRSKKSDKHKNRGNPAKSDDVNVVKHPGYIDNVPILFSFKPKVFFSKKMASVKIGDSEWSDKFTLDTVGSSGSVSCTNKDGSSTEVGVEIRLANTGLSKIVIFTPFYLIVNNSLYDVQCRESLTADGWINIPAGQCVAIWPKFSSSKKELILRVFGTNEETKPFKYSESHSTLLALSNMIGGLLVDCHITEFSCIISIDPYTPGMSNALVMNHCSNTTVYFCQKGATNSIRELEPLKMAYFTWDEPHGVRELLWWAQNAVTRSKNSLIMNGIGEYNVQNDKDIYWVSFLDDIQRVLLFTDDLVIATSAQCTYELERNAQEIEINLPGIGVSLVDDFLKREVLYLALTSSGIIWETAKLNGRRFTAMNVKENQILEAAYSKYIMEQKLNKNPKSRQILEGKIDVDFAVERMYYPLDKKIRRRYQPGFWFQFQSSPHNLQIYSKINRLQIDNQLFECIFPTVFAPVPLPKSVAADAVSKAFIEACILLRKNERSRTKQFKYFKVLVQEFCVKVDQGFINALITLFQQPTTKERDKTKLVKADIMVAKSELKDLVSLISSQGIKNFYDVLHFSPIKVSISFSMQGGGESDPKKPTSIHSEFLNFLLQSVGVTLTEIQDVTFRLGFFEKQHVFMSQKQLINEVAQHYTAQAVKQMYVLVLGLDVIGNPFGLVMGLGKGIEDFFYEPFQGAVEGPEEFAEGLALGIKSLLGHTVGGAAGAFSRITGTLGKGVAALTMDEDYQKKRREALNKRPANLQQGLAQSGKGLFMGVYDGVTGVFVKPIEGAKQEGVGGFFKGMGKGVVGLVARPASGVVDFASGTFDSVKRAADLAEDIQKIRPPRYFQSDGRVRPYTRIEAEGNHLLLELEKGRFASTDNYVAHAVVTDDGRAALIITDKRVIMVYKGDIFGQWNCEWNYTWDDLASTPELSPKGLLILLKSSKKGKKVLGLFGKDMSSKLVEIRSQELTKWIIDKIVLAMKIDS